MGGAFDPMWKDIDETRPGTPYVVDGTGWGFFGVLVLLSVPALILLSIVTGITGWIAAHPVLSGGIYLGIGLAVGVLLYCLEPVKFRVLGIAATILTFLPLGLTMALYAIPYMMIEGGFSSLIDWLLILVILGIVCLMILSWAVSLENGLLHFFIALVPFVLASLLLWFWWTEGSHGWITWSDLRELYGFVPS